MKIAEMPRLITRHSKGFDICCDFIDPQLSIYSDMPGYVDKVMALYKSLGVESALWSVPESRPFESVAIGKEVEYLFHVDENRIITYVDTATWDPYIFEEGQYFLQSITKPPHDRYSALVRVPLRESDLIERRTYRILSGPGDFEIENVFVYF